MNTNYVTATLHPEVHLPQVIPLKIRYKPENALNQREISRLLTAAVINRGFRNLLLSDPIKAISQGFQGEAFHLNEEEKHFLATIQANSLRDFAQQLVNHYTYEKRNGYYHTGTRQF